MAGVVAVLVLSMNDVRCGNNAKEVVLYVSPSGNDSWSGRLPSPNKKKTDGPFATLQRALNEIAKLKAQSAGMLTQPVTIMLRGGVYFLDEPVTITPEHSGNEKNMLIICAYKDEKPVLSGGRKIVGWRKLSQSELPSELKAVAQKGLDVWAAQIPEVKEGKWFFRQLWVNGKRAIRARHPNKGYLQVAEVLDVTKETPWNQGQWRFRFAIGDLKAWDTITDAEIVVMNRWVESRLPIVEFNEKESIVRFGKRSVFRLDKGDPYYLEHCLEVLDAPGEWFLDKRTGTLYYMPREGEDMKTAEVIAPVLTQIVRMVGEPKAGQWVEHIVWKGITFSHAEWYFPPDFNPDGHLPMSVASRKQRSECPEQFTVKASGDALLKIAPLSMSELTGLNSPEAVTKTESSVALCETWVQAALRSVRPKFAATRRSEPSATKSAIAPLLTEARCSTAPSEFG
jgi:hypothetical protein